jgi:uncharacterized protein (DUF58 family)
VSSRRSKIQTLDLLLHPHYYFNVQWRRWWQSRHLPGNTLLLTHRNVYILPTLAGLMLAATLMLLLIGAINYQLSLGYLLTFLLSGCALASMYIGHANVRGLELSLSNPKPCFCGSLATVELKVQSFSEMTRYAIGARLLDSDQWARCDVAPSGVSDIQLKLRATKRGLMPLPALTVQSLFPMGAFRVWSLWQPAAHLLVYPEPEKSPPPLPGYPESSRLSDALFQKRQTEFDGIRSYQRGDALKRIVWKKTAHSGQLVSRGDSELLRTPLYFDLTQTGTGALEQQLSRLCAWVLTAHENGLSFGLRLPEQAIEPANDNNHLMRCLEALARC